MTEKLIQEMTRNALLVNVDGIVPRRILHPSVFVDHLANASNDSEGGKSFSFNREHTNLFF
jgi:hypothetical protein